ncbi:arylacetamide deacetylase-like [Branchiostoma floridae]|uniref:Arylacetamide deacetylase-like n=1 Tax=Branchiostoma floridae TaxID=7739 RepID=A0A9J7LDZ5_BRAFL|nr:arylacetamide deacetylase-like [Branchiostoma floridae]
MHVPVMSRVRSVVVLLVGSSFGGLVMAWKLGVVLQMLGLTLSAVTLCLCYLCYSPAPQGVTEPWKTTVIMSFMRFAGIVVRGYKTLGFGESLDIVRATFGNMKVPCPAEDPRLTIQDMTFGDVKVKLYRPKARHGEQLAGVLYFHGGGWAFGSVDQYDPFNRYIAINTGAVVVCVDYRLAPEYKFPTPLEDCLHATEYFLEHSEYYNVDSSRIGVLGDSSGGNLAAAVALKLNRPEKNLPPLKFQSLLYPALQALDFRTDSYKRGNSMDILTIDMMTFYWCIYLTGSHARHPDFSSNNHVPPELRKRLYSVGTVRSKDNNPVMNLPDDMKDIVNPYFAPLVADDADLRGLPPAYILTCGFDVLGDDGIMYAKRLQTVGVPVVHDHLESAFHGIAVMGFKPFSYSLGRESLKRVVDILRENL